MTEDEETYIIQLLNELKEEFSLKFEKMTEQINTLKAWQSAKDKKSYEREIRIQAYTGGLKWAFKVWESDFGKFCLALAVTAFGGRFIHYGL